MPHPAGTRASSEMGVSDWLLVYGNELCPPELTVHRTSSRFLSSRFLMLDELRDTNMQNCFISPLTSRFF